MLLSFIDQLANSVTAFSPYFLVELSPVCFSSFPATFLPTFPSCFLNGHFSFFLHSINSPPKNSKERKLSNSMRRPILPRVLFLLRLVCGLFAHLYDLLLRGLFFFCGCCALMLLCSFRATFASNLAVEFWSSFFRDFFAAFVTYLLIKFSTMGFRSFFRRPCVLPLQRSSFLCVFLHQLLCSQKFTSLTNSQHWTKQKTQKIADKSMWLPLV